jgi:hypothetical protein
MSEQRMFDVFAEAQGRTPFLERLVLLKLAEWQRGGARWGVLPPGFPRKLDRKKPWHRTR